MPTSARPRSVSQPYAHPACGPRRPSWSPRVATILAAALCVAPLAPGALGCASTTETQRGNAAGNAPQAVEFAALDLRWLPANTRSVMAAPEGELVQLKSLQAMLGAPMPCVERFAAATTRHYIVSAGLTTPATNVFVGAYPRAAFEACVQEAHAALAARAGSDFALTATEREGALTIFTRASGGASVVGFGRGGIAWGTDRARVQAMLAPRPMPSAPHALRGILRDKQHEPYMWMATTEDYAHYVVGIPSEALTVTVVGHKSPPDIPVRVLFSTAADAEAAAATFESHAWHADLNPDLRGVLSGLTAEVHGREVFVQFGPAARVSTLNALLKAQHAYVAQTASSREGAPGGTAPAAPE